MKVGIVGSGFVGVTAGYAPVMHGEGIIETFPLPLNEEVTARLRDSAGVIRQALGELGEPLTNSHRPGQARGPAGPAREAT